MGWLIFGALGAALVAEMCYLYKKEEMEADKQGNECACKCNCCHHEEEEKHECCGHCHEDIEVVDSVECKCGCCHKDEE